MDKQNKVVLDPDYEEILRECTRLGELYSGTRSVEVIESITAILGASRRLLVRAGPSTFPAEDERWARWRGTSPGIIASIFGLSLLAATACSVPKWVGEWMEPVDPSGADVSYDPTMEPSFDYEIGIYPGQIASMANPWEE